MNDEHLATTMAQLPRIVRPVLAGLVFLSLAAQTTAVVGAFLCFGPCGSVSNPPAEAVAVASLGLAFLSPLAAFGITYVYWEVLSVPMRSLGAFPAMFVLLEIAWVAWCSF